MLWVLSGCVGVHPMGLGGRVVDLRASLEEPPDPGLQIVTPEQVVEPYEEQIFCFTGTYEGETIGVNSVMSMDTQGVTHHNQVKRPLSEPPADGTLEPCEDAGEFMSENAPMFETAGSETDVAENDMLRLPDGMAVKLSTGTPWVHETHYINASADRILVQSAMNLGFVPADEVEIWLGTFEYDSGPLSLDPGPASVTFECAWPKDAVVYSMLGHMHDYGTSFSVEWVHAEGEELLYEVAEWEPQFKSEPIVADYSTDTLSVSEGDVFRVTCTWDNTTDEVLGFPSEMCTLTGTAYDFEDPIRCIDGVFDDETHQGGER